MESTVLGGGCFWCLDASFKLIKGITEVVSGYAGGNVENPDYGSVCDGSTGHAEVVRVTFDTSILSLNDVLDIFWAVHDPTTLDRQGNDVGSQYRSAIYYETDEQLPVIQKSIEEVQKLWDSPVVSEVKKLDKVYPAEAYHQDYFANNPEQAYCQVVINPKLIKLKEKFSQRLK
jgi:peptide-methionine (S)-S-oxide reductase